MLRSRGARPPYCSGSSSLAATGRGWCVALLRWCGFTRLSQPPQEQAAGGAGARGVRVQLRPPPAVAVPPGGGGTPFLPRGGVEGRRPRGPQARGGRGGGGGGGRAAVPCPPVPGGWSMALVPVPLGTPPGYTRSAGVAGQPWAPGAAWLAAGGSVWRGEGGEGFLCLGLPPPAFSGWAPWRAALSAHFWVPPFTWPTASAQSHRSAAANAGVSGRPTLGAWHATAPPGAAVPPLGAAALSGGHGDAAPSGWPPAAYGLEGGGRGGEGGGRGGGEGGFLSVPPWSPGAAPRLARGDGPVVPVQGGRLPPGGAHPSPASVCPPGARPPCRSSLGPPALLTVTVRRRPARGVGGGLVSAGGGSSGQRSVVSGLRGSGPPLTLVAPVLSPTGGGARPCAAPYEWGVSVGGPGSAWGGRPAVDPPPHAHCLGRRGAAITCVVACVRAGAAAVAGSAGGSASG